MDSFHHARFASCNMDV